MIGEESEVGVRREWRGLGLCLGKSDEEYASMTLVCAGGKERLPIGFGAFRCDWVQVLGLHAEEHHHPRFAKSTPSW